MKRSIQVFGLCLLLLSISLAIPKWRYRVVFATERMVANDLATPTHSLMHVVC